MITRDKAIDRLEKLVKGKKFSVLRWENTRFWILKVGSTAEREDIGEDLLRILLSEAGYENAKLSGKGRRGEWDASCQGARGEARFKVKAATQDIHEKHQFNGIRPATNYTHLFLLGVLPEDVRFRIIAKKGRDQYKLVPMSKGTNTNFKLTLSSSDLHSFDRFNEEIAKVLGQP